MPSSHEQLMLLAAAHADGVERAYRERAVAGGYTAAQVEAGVAIVRAVATQSYLAGYQRRLDEERAEMQEAFASRVPGGAVH